MSRHTITWFAIFVVIALMFLRLPQMAAKQDTVLSTYSALVEVDALAKENFVEPVDDDRLVQGAIRGMMVQLDPYSGYISPSQLPNFERRAHGAYQGTGIEVGFRQGLMTVIAAIEGSPAARQGVLPGDEILSIDGADTDPLSVFEVEERLVGPPGRVVRLVTRRPGAEESHEFEIPCGAVSVMTVRGFRRLSDGRWDYLIDPDHGIGYVRVSRFIDTTVRDFEAALRELLSKDARGLVIDLRFNPGGMMHQAIAMVDRFVGEGVILATVTRRGVVQKFHASGRATLREMPLAVLVNSASASASEIVAGSLQDHGRATIIGERTFGKGSVQQLIYLTEQRSAIKLTTAHYCLPNGRIIHRTPENVGADTWGVTPDIVVPLGQNETRAIQASRRAVDEPGGTSPGGLSAGTGVGSDSASATIGAPSVREVLRDRQLTQALDRLARPMP